jgi:hypothetical protein
MTVDQPTVEGLSLRLVPDPSCAGAWSVAVRNDGPSTLRDGILYVSEGGIPTPGDLGSTIVRTHRLDPLGPSDEFRFGPFQFVPGGDYLDLPLSASLFAQGRELLTLNVTTDDFERPERLRAAEGPTAQGRFLAMWLGRRM